MSKELTVPELKNLSDSKAKAIRATFEPMADMLEQFESAFDEVLKEAEDGIDALVISKAKRLRLDIAKVRIETGKLKDKQKEYIKLEDKAIMGVHNILVHAVKEKEDKLKEIEKHFELIEQKRLEELQKERAEALTPYVEDAHERDLASMEDDVWEPYFNAKKQAHEDRIAAEKEAERLRLEKEEEERKERERIKKENEKLKKEAEAKEKLYQERNKKLNGLWDTMPEKYADTSYVSMSDKEFSSMLKDANKAKVDLEKAIKKKQKEIGVRQRLASEFLIEEGFELTDAGAEAKDYHHFIGLKHFSELESDGELKDFKNEVLKTKQKALKEKKEKEAREAKLRAEEEKRKKLEAEIEAKKKAEEKVLKEEEERKQAGDSDKVKYLINDLEELKTKYTFKSEKNQKMYKDVNNLLGKVINHIKK